MKRSLFTLASIAYIGLAAYSIGNMPTSSASRPTVKMPAATAPRVMLASPHLAELVNFYNEVFDADLQPVVAGDANAAPNYEGKLGDMALLLCPKANLKGKAERKRLPLHVAVVDIGASLARIAAAGGSITGKLSETAREKRIVVGDPDGNLIELTQAKS